MVNNNLSWDNSSTEGIDVLSGKGSRDSESSSLHKHSFAQWSRRAAGRWVTHPFFKRTVLGLIILSQIVLGIYTWAEPKDDAALDALLVICRGILRTVLVTFTIELVLEVAHHQTKTWKRGWIVTDVVVVTTTWFTGVLPILILRGFRLIRALRKASAVRALRNVVKAFLYAVPYLLALAGLLAFLLYMFAVLFTHVRYLHSDNEKQEEGQNEGGNLNETAYFSSIRASAMTLFQIMTGGRIWGDLLDAEAQMTELSLMLVAFVCIAVFAFGGMAIAIMVQAFLVTGSSGVMPGLAWSKSGQNISPSHSILSPPRGSPPAPPTDFSSVQDQPTSLHRLEQRVDGLSRTVDQLLGMQVALHESMNKLLALQHHQLNPTASAEDYSL